MKTRRAIQSATQATKRARQATTQAGQGGPKLVNKNLKIIKPLAVTHESSPKTKGGGKKCGNIVKSTPKTPAEQTVEVQGTERMVTPNKKKCTKKETPETGTKHFEIGTEKKPPCDL